MVTRAPPAWQQRFIVHVAYDEPVEQDAPPRQLQVLTQRPRFYRWRVVDGLKQKRAQHAVPLGHREHRDVDAVDVGARYQ